MFLFSFLWSPFSFVISLVRILPSWDRLGRRAKGELAASRFARSVDGKLGHKVRRHSLERQYAGMTRQKKTCHGGRSMVSCTNEGVLAAIPAAGRQDFDSPNHQ